MKFGVLLFVTLIFNSIISSQNLIPNPGFEEIDISNADNKSYYSYRDWNSLMPYKRISFDSRYSTLLQKIKKESITLDSILIEWYKPHSGDICFGPPFIFFKNIYQAELLKPIIKDSTYYFEMYYKLSMKKTPAKNLIDGQVGVFFTNRDFRDSTSMWKLSKNKLRYTPQIVITKLDSTAIDNWVKFSFEYKSDKDYKYIIIGNHQKLVEQKPEMYTKRIGLTYRLDDLLMTPKYQKQLSNKSKIENEINLSNIQFNHNSSILTKGAFVSLDNIVDLLMESNYKFDIIGHTDNTGTEKRNEKLSLSRAKSVYDYFISKGIDESSMNYKGMGDSSPISNNETEEGREKNRRVEFKVK